jgi:predicted transcriptional regulator
LPRKKSFGLTDAELRVMEVLWDKGSATVSGVAESLTGPPLAYSSVLTTLRILDSKGHVRHSKESRAFVYRAVTGREQARDKAITHLLKRFFNGSPELLMLNLVDSRKIDEKELARLRQKIRSEDQGGK